MRVGLLALVALVVVCVVCVTATEHDALWDDYVSALSSAGVTVGPVSPSGPGGCVGCRGLWASAHAPTGTVLASVPPSAKMYAPSRDEAVTVPVPPQGSGPSVSASAVVAYAVAQGLPPRVALALSALSHVQGTAESSALDPLIDILPEHFHDAPLFYTPHVRAEIHGSAKARVDQMLRELAGFTKVVDQLGTMYPGILGDVAHEDIGWAYYLAASRGRAGPDGSHYLVPIVDAVRTGPGGNARIEEAKSGRVSLVATRDIAAGEEIVLDAGFEPVGALFALHGASLGGANVDSASFVEMGVMESSLDADNMFTATVVELLTHMGCIGPAASNARFYKSNSSLPSSYMNCMRVSLLTPADYARIEAYEDAAGVGWPHGEPFSVANDLAVLANVYASVQAALEEYPTTVAEDDAALANADADADAPASLAASIRVRRMEKNLLGHLKAVVEATWMARLSDAADLVL